MKNRTVLLTKVKEKWGIMTIAHLQFIGSSLAPSHLIVGHSPGRDRSYSSLFCICGNQG